MFDEHLSHVPVGNGRVLFQMGDVLPNPEWGRLKEEVMRKRITLAAAAALFSAAALMSGPTQAMPFGSPQMPAGVRRETAKEFRGRKHNQVCRRKTKAAGQYAFDKIDMFQRGIADDLAEPFDLAFGLKINDDAGVACPPILQSCDELRSFRFDENEIADRKFTDVAILKCAAEIFRTVFNPSFTNTNLRSTHTLIA